MSQMVCYNCGNRMWNGMVPNAIEYYLISTDVELLQEKEYNKTVKRVNAEQKKWYKKGDKDYKYIDTWYDICSDLGNYLWICPECKTIHIFDKDKPWEVERVYNLVDEKEWRKRPSETTYTGLDAKYDKLLIKFGEARGHYEYRELGDKLRNWEKAGEIREVRTFCRIIIEMFPNRPALIFEMEKFLSKQENDNRHYIAGVVNELDKLDDESLSNNKS